MRTTLFTADDARKLVDTMENLDPAVSNVMKLVANAAAGEGRMVRVDVLHPVAEEYLKIHGYTIERNGGAEAKISW